MTSSPANQAAAEQLQAPGHRRWLPRVGWGSPSMHRGVLVTVTARAGRAHGAARHRLAVSGDQAIRWGTAAAVLAVAGFAAGAEL
jgi:hypothetical protein